MKTKKPRLSTNGFKFNKYVFVWETFEAIGRYTGLNFFWFLSLFYPKFGPWLFGKMTGLKGCPVKGKCKK